MFKIKTPSKCFVRNQKKNQLGGKKFENEKNRKLEAAKKSEFFRPITITAKFVNRRWVIVDVNVNVDDGNVGNDNEYEKATSTTTTTTT